METIIDEFNNKSINWIIFFVKTIIFFDLIAILVLTLNKEDITYESMFIYTFVAALLCGIIYLKHIKKIILTNERLYIVYNYKISEDLLCNYDIKEKVKQRGLIRYYRLIIYNRITKRSFKIDSDEWIDYKKIKELLIKKNY